MRDLSCPSAVSVVFALVFLLVLANNAHAYIGPGAGLDLVNYAFGLGSLLTVASFGILLWPFYAILRLIRRQTATQQAQPTVPAVEQSAEGVSNS